MWQGLLDWWNPAGVATVPDDERIAPDGVDRRGSEPAVDASEAWVRRDLVSQEVARSTAEDEVSEQELLDFLAADNDPIEANPAFKRRLREQLWAMIRDDHMTRQ